jgi:hypothetical protein
MNYTVIWLPHALGQLTTVWINSPNREAVTAASHRIDVRLADSPNDTGESRDAGRRIAFEYPLRVEFRVSEPDHAVYVIQVGDISRRS